MPAAGPLGNVMIACIETERDCLCVVSGGEACCLPVLRCFGRNSRVRDILGLSCLGLTRY